MTQKDAREGLDPFLFSKVKELSGQCGDSQDEAAFSSCVLGLLPPDQAQQLTQAFGDRLGSWLKQAIGWHSDLIAREIDRLLLEVFLAAEAALGDMTVDRGVRPGWLNQQWLMEHFQPAPKAESRGRIREAVEAARREIEGDMERRKKALGEVLTAWGRARLSRLEDAPGKARVLVSDRDLPLLIDFYGEGFFDWLEAARSAVGEGALEVGYNPVPTFGVVMEKKAGAARVKLPPASDSDRARTALALALRQLQKDGSVAP